MSDYDPEELPRTDGLELALLSEAENAENYRDLWGTILDDEVFQKLDSKLTGGEADLDVASVSTDEGYTETVPDDPLAIANREYVDSNAGDGSGADPAATYVTTDDETPALDNSEQHANLSGEDLHGPATHGAGAHDDTVVDDVFGRTGSVSAQSGDYSYSQIGGTHGDEAHDEIDAATWDGYEVQKDGTDGIGIINFKTS